MRTLRPSLLTAAGVGGAALLGVALSPGVAGAAPGAAETVAADQRTSVTATATDECTVDFALATDEDTDWVVDYRVDDEEPTADSGDGADPLYNPVVTNQRHVADTLNAAEGRNYLVGVDAATADLRGYGPGMHTVTFTLRSGPNTDDGAAQDEATGSLVIDCFTEDDPGDGGALNVSRGPDPADVFGGLVSTES